MNLLGSLIQRGILIGEKFVDYNYHTSPKRKQEIDWDEKTVCEWMKRENISDRIKVNIKQLNGQMLFQLYNMLKYNPEFFYGALKNDYDLSGWTGLKDLAHFCTKLTDLFEDK